MDRRTIALLVLVFCCLIGMLVNQPAAGQHLPKPPDKDDKCPVCGMFVHRYPDWLGQITFNDGRSVYFDGAKDLFKYYFNLIKYEPSKKPADIAHIYVTEYYDGQLIEARRAFFVIGSDVFGPMGNELIPLQSRADAVTFKKDHLGRRILQFGDVTPAIIGRLD